MTAILERLGTTSFKSSSSFVLNSGKSKKRPVILPPGRAKLAIIPVATGSVSKSNATMGVVAVADRTASAAAAADGYDNVDILVDQFNRHWRKSRRIAVSETWDEFHFLRHAIPSRAQSSQKRIDTRGGYRARAGIEKSHLGNFWLLRPRSKRPSGRSAARSVINSRRSLPPGGEESRLVGARIDVGQGPATRNCPLSVKSGHMQRKTSCPLWAQKQTCAVQLGMSALCQ